jgi:hypothetical protein
VSSAVLNTVPFILPAGRNLYGLNACSDNEIIITDARNYMNNGELLIYSKSGHLKKSFTTGVNPGWIEVYQK